MSMSVTSETMSTDKLNVLYNKKKKKGKKKGKGGGGEIKMNNNASMTKKDEFSSPLPTPTQFRENQKRQPVYYKPYMQEDRVKQGLENGELIKGTLRISQRNSQEAYIDNTAKDGFSDFLILGVRDRNRALNGDVVVVKPKSRDSWVLRTSAFRNWKEENNIGSDFEISLNNLHYDAESVGSASGNEDEEGGAGEKGNAAEALLTAAGGDGFSLVDEDDIFVNEKENMDVDRDNISFDLEDDDVVNPMFLLALEKLIELRSSRRDKRKIGVKKTESEPIALKYDRKQLLRYRRRVPQDYAPAIEDEVKSMVMRTKVAHKHRKPLPFQFVGNFDKNNEIPDSLIIRTCEVVYIAEKKLFYNSPFNDCAGSGRARAAGRLVEMDEEMLTLFRDHFQRHQHESGRVRPPPAIFIPTDARLPKMMISHEQLPKDFVARPQDFSNVIFVAELCEDWSAETSLARGRFLRKIGEFGELDAETTCLLLLNNVDTKPFPREVLEELKEFIPNLKYSPKKNQKNKSPADKNYNSGDAESEFLNLCKAHPFKINRKLLESRRDFRANTIFTIDPATARDLDDALHVCASQTAEGEDCWEVGVHIADVSYFVQPGGLIDKWARHRGTSVYLVDQVIPMLPRVLSEELCSLNPGLNRLTFSVVWKMDHEGNILEEWFGRSVIRSCAKLSYDHAQEFIDYPDRKLTYKLMPENIYYKNCQKILRTDGAEGLKRLGEIRDCVLILNDLARCLRQRRFANGALRLDAPKLKIKFSDDGHKFPCGVCMDERADANFLVEEFMLLANMAVAKRISTQFPDVALLRRHPAPKPQAFDEAMDRCERLGFPLGSGKTGKEISEALCRYEAQPNLKRTVMPILFQYMLRSMQLATYFCTGVAKSHDDFKHFALSVDRYTHFTSPIRRYPDIIVHRLLSACLGYRKKPRYTPEQVEAVARHCNITKVAAKAVSDGCAEIFFNSFIKEVGRFETYGIVTHVADSYFEVILLEFGLTERVNLSMLENMKSRSFKPPENGRKSKSGTLNLSFKHQRITNKVIGKKENAEPLDNDHAEQTDKCVEEEEEKELISITINMLSIVKVALLPDKKKPGKHYGIIVVNPKTIGLTFEDVCRNYEPLQEKGSNLVETMPIDESLTDFE